MVAVVYFAFTTLATVGYGDYHPVSNTELLVGKDEQSYHSGLLF